MSATTPVTAVKHVKGVLRAKDFKRDSSHGTVYVADDFEFDKDAPEITGRDFICRGTGE